MSNLIDAAERQIDRILRDLELEYGSNVQSIELLQLSAGTMESPDRRIRQTSITMHPRAGDGFPGDHLQWTIARLEDRIEILEETLRILADQVQSTIDDSDRSIARLVTAVHDAHESIKAGR